MTLRIPMVVRVDAIQEGDTSLDGKQISVELVENEENVAGRRDQGLKDVPVASDEQVPDPEIVGSAPTTAIIQIEGYRREVSPSDLVVVMR